MYLIARTHLANSQFEADMRSCVQCNKGPNEGIVPAAPRQNQIQTLRWRVRTRSRTRWRCPPPSWWPCPPHPQSRRRTQKAPCETCGLPFVEVVSTLHRQQGIWEGLVGNSHNKHNTDPHRSCRAKTSCPCFCDVVLGQPLTGSHELVLFFVEVHHLLIAVVILHAVLAAAAATGPDLSLKPRLLCRPPDSHTAACQALAGAPLSRRLLPCLTSGLAC